MNAANDNANKMPFPQHTHSITIEQGTYRDSWLCTPPKVAAQQWAEAELLRQRGNAWGPWSVKLAAIG